MVKKYRLTLFSMMASFHSTAANLMAGANISATSGDRDVNVVAKRRLRHLRIYYIVSNVHNIRHTTVAARSDDVMANTSTCAATSERTVSGCPQNCATGSTLLALFGCIV